MDSAYFEHLRNQVLQEFPRLVDTLGEGKAREELEAAMLDRSHMLYPEEIQEITNEALQIGGLAVSEVIGSQVEVQDGRTI